MTRRALEGRLPISPQNEGYESRESAPTTERSPDVPSEDNGELPVPGEQAAVNEPLQPEPLLIRLRPRGALRRPERLIEQF